MRFDKCIECDAVFDDDDPPACKIPIEIELNDGSVLFLPDEETVGYLCAGCKVKLVKLFRSIFPTVPIEMVVDKELGGEE